MTKTKDEKAKRTLVCPVCKHEEEVKTRFAYQTLMKHLKAKHGA